MALKQCKKGEHIVDDPIFKDPRIGELIGWKCECGEKTEGPQECLERLRKKTGPVITFVGEPPPLVSGT